MPTRFPFGINCDPFRVCFPGVVISGMRVSASNDRHPHFATTCYESSEGIRVPEPGAAMVERNGGWVISNAPACAQASGIRVGALKITEPKLEVEFGGIIFY